MKKLIKSVICGSRTLFTGPTELIKTLKSQQLPATVHMNSSRCSLNGCAAAGKKKKKVKERKRKRKKLDPNPAILSKSLGSFSTYKLVSVNETTLLTRACINLFPSFLTS